MPTAAIYDCEGALPPPDELAFFKEVDPLGFILFADHCPGADNVRKHIGEIKNALGRDDLLFLIDQEGGRVARMKPPAFPAHPPMATLGKLWRLDPKKALEAAELNGFLLGRMVSELGVNVNCAPMLDVPQIDADPKVIGDRALATHPDQISALAGAYMTGQINGGALPVIKHLPGHGRALVDSHEDLPNVCASIDDLRDVDFAPFKDHASALMGMTGHVVYDAIDKDRCATMSPTVISKIIRGEIGFDGLLFSDDLRMGALTGDLGERVRDCLAAGCDVALCCNFTLAEKQAAAAHAEALTGDALRRVEAVRAALQDMASSAPMGGEDEYQRLASLLKPALNA